MKQGWNRAGRYRKILGFSLLLPLIACQGKPPAPPVDAKDSAEKDRHELVLGSRDPWTPENVPRKLSVQLIAESIGFVRGQGLRYRLEIKNVGKEAVVFKEDAPSFIKSGSLCGASGFRFYATPPSGPEEPMDCDDDASVRASTDTAIDLTLQSGEYLLTRADGPQNRFRALRTKFRFDKRGSYRIRVVYSAPELTAESNALVVTPIDEKKQARPRVAVSSRTASAVPAGASHE